MGLDATLSGTISYFHYAGVGRSIAYYPRGGRRAPLGKASWFLVLGELASLILYFGATTLSHGPLFMVSFLY